jgi:hypothetical protein
MSINFNALFQRVLELLTNPKKTFDKIKTEPDSGRLLIVRYVLLLAIIPVACGFIGILLFDERFEFGDRFLFSLVSSTLKWGVFVSSVFVLGMITKTMAPMYDSQSEHNPTLKLAAYVSTPVWVVGFASLVPQLTPLAALAGFGYSIHLFQTGAQVLLQTPQKRAWTFAWAAVITWFVFTLVTAWIVIQIAGLLFAPSIIVDGLLVQQPNPWNRS